MTPKFVDHYETLQLSPTVTLEVVERVHRRGNPAGCPH